MKRIFYYVGFLLTALCLWFFAKRFAMHWQALRELSLDTRLFGWLAAATIAYLITHILAANGWRNALLLCGQRLPALACIRISMVTQFAKFLPGNVGQHIGRVVLTMRAGVSGKAATVSIFLDMGMLCLVAGIMSLLNLDTAVAVLAQHRIAVPTWLQLVVPAIAILAAAATWKFWPKRFAYFVHMIRAEFARLQQRGLRPLLRPVSEAAISHAASFSLGAAALACILAGISAPPLPTLHVILGAFVAAWLLGFIIPGSPAGIGIREFVLVLSLGPVLGEQTAVLAAALLRLITTAGDGLAFLIGLALTRLPAAAANSLPPP